MTLAMTFWNLIAIGFENVTIDSKFLQNENKNGS